MTITPIGTTAQPTPAPQASASAQAAAAPKGSAKVAEKNAMDGDMFMKLLITQLSNQDPSSPMDSTQMISQTTQLAMMEKLTELSDTSTEDFSLQMRVAAASILGQEVTYTGPDGVDVTGTASAVSYAAGVPVVTVGTAQVPLDAISGIRRAAA